MQSWFCFSFLICYFLSPIVLSAPSSCPGVDNLVITLRPGEIWTNICETASPDGHLHNYSIFLLTPADYRAQVRGMSGAGCYSNIPPDPSQGWQCLRNSYNCTQVSYASQTPVCLLINNPSNNTVNLTLQVSVSYDIPVDAIDPLFPLQYYLLNTGQQNGTVGEDINVAPVWAQNITGNGVVIDFLGDSLYINHQDIKDKVRLDLSWNYRTQVQDPTGGRWSRGTGCAGIAAGAAGNNVCGKGTAYGAQLAAHRLPRNDPFTLGAALYDTAHGNDTIDISVCVNCQIPACYGFSFCNYFPENPFAAESLEQGTLLGRRGKGRIYIMPAGGNVADGNITNSDVNMNPYTKQRQVISVVGTNNRGYRDITSDVGAAILVNAPSVTVRNYRLYRSSGGLSGRGAGVTTIATFSDTGCTSNFHGGARTAAAIVSGVVALVLEVNPNLNWREVQKLLIDTSDKNAPNSTSWLVNAAGYNYSRYFGFGRVNAAKAVAKAKEWLSSGYQIGQEQVWSTKVLKVDTCIPDGSAGPLAAVTIAETGIHNLEDVQVSLNVEHPSIGDLTIWLTSPSGTKILLKNNTPSSIPHWATRVVNRFPLFVSNFVNYPLHARVFFGENPNGKWVINISDTVNNNISGTFQSFYFLFWGTGPGCFTNENNCSNQSPPLDLQLATNSCNTDTASGTSHTLAIIGGLIGGFVVGAVGVWWYFTSQKKAQQQQVSGLEAVLTADLDSDEPSLQ